ncbi:MAG: hypothetical protein C0429_15685 [Sphingopyxis sp.]|nr:hypothetical protein [Sphingopyxis sp.]
MTWYTHLSKWIAAGCTLAAAPCVAQDAPPAIMFQTGTGNAPVAQPVYVKPPRAEIACETLGLAERAISYGYYGGLDLPRQRLDGALFATALTKYREHHCSFGRSSGPAVIVIVDFAKHSSEPRLYRVDLRSGDGLDSPIRVAHGIGSDPDDDGYATVFSNVQDSLTSSLGASRGGERYVGINGLSLRLDGLEPSNNQMRVRDIVVHSYMPERRRYFNASLIAARGRPGSSEGCFVVEPDKREWILETLENGGFLYAGFSGKLPQPIIPVANPNVIFARGTGATPSAALQPAAPPISGIAAGTPGTPPTDPISPEPTASGR